MSSHDDLPTENTSANEEFHQVLDRALKSPMRRNILLGGLGLPALSTIPMLSACGGGGESAAAAAPSILTQAAASLGSFKPTTGSVAKTLADQITIADGYSFKVIHATGDRLFSDQVAYSNTGAETDDWRERIGDHHDGMDLYYISSNGAFSRTATNRAVLVVNHESSADAHFFHPRGQTTNGTDGKKFTQFGGWDTGVRPGAEVLKEINQHGVSIVELTLGANASGYSYKLDSPYNRRITPQTEMDITGPAAELSNIRRFMVTAFDTTGATCRGTINNCGHGYTPWGTYLACEENWAFYFNIPNGTSVTGLTAKDIASRDRYGLPRTAISGSTATSQGWFTVTDLPNEQGRFSRWNLGTTGANAAADYRNEGNTFGYNVEIDPLNPASRPKKRVAMGRFAHEAAAFSIPVVGKPLAFYMGCDSRSEYVYKFVTTAVWSESDIGRGLEAGSKYLNEGKLYAAKFNDNGTGTWEELTFADGRIKSFAGYTFENQADVLVNTRLAADAVGATKMDRPEWAAVNPVNGEVYFTMTNNRTRETGNKTNAANPRAYVDDGRTGDTNTGNPNGHIIRFRENNNDAAATGFRWDIYLFGAEDNADNPDPNVPKYSEHVNISGLTTSNAFSSPDGVWFSRVSGILWIQTDDNAFTGECNNQLLAALPGKVGDGGERTITNSVAGVTPATQKTFVGAAVSEAKLRRFLVGPKGAEITGLTETADGKAIFVNIQHPGENTPQIGTNPTFNFESQWPSNDPTSPYAPGPRPRSATIVITKNDGGVIGT